MKLNDTDGVPACPPMDSYIVPQQGPQPGIAALTPDGVPGHSWGCAVKRLAWRLVSFAFAFLILSLLWLIFDVPFAIRYWFEDRWRFITELWETTGETTDA